MKNQMTVDRREFNAWCDGILLLYREGGKVLLVDEKTCEDAENELIAGKEVLCRDGSVLTGTKIIMRDNQYIEVEI